MSKACEGEIKKNKVFLKLKKSLQHKIYDAI